MDKMDDDKLICEGRAKIRRHPKVFYNNVQEFNRDLSVLVIHTYLKHELWKFSLPSSTSIKNYVKDRISILDALSATGLRSIRYSLECRQCILPIEIIANDISEEAIKIIESNIELNQTYNVIVTNEDANILMYKKKSLNERITIIDLDPFGCPTPFLDSAVQNIVDGGLLMVTSTDMAVLCGNHQMACFAKYGSVPLHAKFCHESALRIVCAAVNSIAARYGRHAIPLLSLSIDFYVRIFFRIVTSKNEAQRSMQKLSYVYLCKSCESFRLQPLCETQNDNEKNLVPSTVLCDKICTICGQQQRIGGPIWSAPIHDKQFVEKLQNELRQLNDLQTNRFGTYRRMEGLLQLVQEELDDCPLYYHLDRLCSLLCCPLPTMKTFYTILSNHNYRYSLSHAYKNTLKTDAPNEFIWAMIQFIARKSSISMNNLRSKRSEYIQKIMEKQFEIKINDTEAEDIDDNTALSKRKNLLRYQQNPERYWGPKSRPKANDIGDQSANSNNSKRSFEDDDQHDSMDSGQSDDVTIKLMKT